MPVSSAGRARDAVALAQQGTLGLVCDPLGGLVELPCVFRNATGESRWVLNGEDDRTPWIVAVMSFTMLLVAACGLVTAHAAAELGGAIGHEPGTWEQVAWYDSEQIRATR